MEKITKEHLSKRTESTKVVINGITTEVCIVPHSALGRPSRSCLFGNPLPHLPQIVIRDFAFSMDAGKG